MIGFGDDLPENEAAFQAPQDARVRHAGEQLVQAPVRPVQKDLLGDGGTRFDGDLSVLEQALDAFAPEVVEPPRARFVRGGAADLAREAVEEAAERTGGARVARALVRAASQLEQAELDLKWDDAPPVLAQVFAERRRQLAGEEPLHPRAIRASLARAAEIADPAERKGLASLLGVAGDRAVVAQPGRTRPRNAIDAVRR